MKRRNLGFIAGLAGGVLVASVATSLAGTMTSGSSGTSASKPATTTTNTTTSAAATSRLQLVDASGKLVGYPVDLGATTNVKNYIGVNISYSYAVVYSPTLKDIFAISLDGTPLNWSFFYTGANCTGTPISFEDDVAFGTRVKHAVRIKVGDPFVWYQADTANVQPASKSTLTIQSQTDGSSCQPIDLPVQQMSGTVVTWKQTNAPFGPYTGPLKLVLGN